MPLPLRMIPLYWGSFLRVYFLPVMLVQFPPLLVIILNTKAISQPILVFFPLHQPHTEGPWQKKSSKGIFSISLWGTGSFSIPKKRTVGLLSTYTRGFQSHETSRERRNPFNTLVAKSHHWWGCYSYCSRVENLQHCFLDSKNKTENSHSISLLQSYKTQFQKVWEITNILKTHSGKQNHA